MILEQARAMHMAACEPYRGSRIRGVAYPFGIPDGMPPHVWRVSWDIMQALYNASPPPVGPNPKSGDDGTTRLFGWPVIRDKALPNGTMRLELRREAADKLAEALR